MLIVGVAFPRHSSESWCGGVVPRGLGPVQGRKAEGKCRFGGSLVPRVEGALGTEWSGHLSASVALFPVAVSQPLAFQMAGRDLPYVPE